MAVYSTAVLSLYFIEDQVEKENTGVDLPGKLL